MDKYGYEEISIGQKFDGGVVIKTSNDNNFTVEYPDGTHVDMVREKTGVYTQRPSSVLPKV